VFYQLAGYFEREVETNKQLKEAMRYPIMVISSISVALVILNMMVIPQFAAMFERFNVELPLPTRIILATSNFFLDFWPYMLAVLIGSMIAFRQWLKTDSGRYKWDRFKLKMPLIGDIMTRAQLARFSRSFSLMLRSGVGLTHALALSGETSGNRYLEVRINGMKEAIEAGATVSSTATSSGIFTPLVLQMIAVGEETGQMDNLLVEVADFYDREIDYDLKNLTSKIEPILLVAVAGMVLILALGIFLPMWNMLDLMQGK